MLSTRGDAHKFYKKLRKTYAKHKSLRSIKEINEISDIQGFYRQFSSDDLNKIKYRMEKEKNGSGIFPILVSSLPWILFIFSKQLQEYLLQDDSRLLLWGFVFAYLSFIIFTIVLHFREKAWATVHIKILEDILKEREST